MDADCWFSVRGNRGCFAFGSASGQPEEVEQSFQVQVFARFTATSGDIFFDSSGDFGFIPIGCYQGNEKVF